MVEVPTQTDLDTVAMALNAKIDALAANSLPTMPDAVKENLINVLTNLPPVLEWLKQVLQPTVPNNP